jgi:hypothetical protein
MSKVSGYVRRKVGYQYGTYVNGAALGLIFQEERKDKLRLDDCGYDYVHWTRSRSDLQPSKLEGLMS